MGLLVSLKENKFVGFKKLVYLVTMATLFSVVAVKAEESNESFLNLKKNYDSDGIEIYESNYHLRDIKKFGIGTQIGGSVGLFGVNGEFNLDMANAVIFGLGAGPGYQSYNLRWKYSYEGRYLSPYLSAGYAKWYNSTGNKSATKDSDVLNRILTDSEKQTGRFGADFIVGVGGLEYNQLEGEMSGITFYGELALMHEIKRATMVPTGSLGITYLF